MSSITTIRPNGQVSNASWTIGGGAGSTNAATSDNTDVTYILSPTVPNKTVLLTMGNVSAPAAGTYRPRLRIRVRAARSTTLQPDNLVIWAVDSNGNFLAGMDTMVDSTTITDYTGGWYYPIEYGVKQLPSSWSDSTLNDIRLRVYVRRGPDATQTLAVRVYELYIDVENNDLPVTVVNAPTGTVIDTDKPIINITASDTEGDAITGYYVEVKTANATGPGPTGGGTTLWESGEIDVADATDLNIKCGVALPTDVTTGYEVYAYTYSVSPSGGKVTSAYAVGSTFYIDPAAVASPEIISSAEVDVEGVPVYKLTAISRLNILSFTDSTLNASLGTWVASGTGANIAYEASTGRTDTHRMRCFRTGSTGTILAVAAGPLALGYGMVPGEDHTGTDLQVSMMAWVRNSGVSRQAQCVLLCRNSSLVTLATLTGTAVADTNLGWTAITVTGTIPAGTVLVSPRIQFLNVPVGEDHYVDDISVCYGSIPTWNIGGRANSGLGIAAPTILFTDANGKEIKRADVLIDNANTVYLNDYELTVGTANTYSVYQETRDDSVTSISSPAVVVGPHVGLSGWWFTADNQIAIAVNLIGNTYDTEYWEDAAQFVPLGRKDTISVTDGSKYPKRRFEMEVFTTAHADIFRSLLDAASDGGSEGRFWLQGTWPSPETARYRVTSPIKEESENTEPDRFVFSFDTQMIDRL